MFKLDKNIRAQFTMLAHRTNPASLAHAIGPYKDLEISP